MELVLNEFYKALGYLFITGIIYFIYNTSYESSVIQGYKKVLVKGFLYVLVIALFTSITLGSPTCETQSDPLYGGCEQYADDGFIPTQNERVADFVYFITLLYPPVIFGALRGRKICVNKSRC